MTNKRIDLHMHSAVSDDGQYSPSELMQMCYDAGLEIVALADHNSLKGVPEAKKRAQELGVTYIPAVELDCTLEGQNFHLLGYFIEDKFGWFAENEKTIHENGLIQGEEMMSKVEALGIAVDKQEIRRRAGTGVITGELIAEVALEDRLNEGNELLMKYRKGGERSDNPLVNFYWDYCSQGKPAYSHMEFPSFEKAVEQIKRVDGVPVIAHPGANMGCNIEMLKQMKDIGIEGVEAYSSYHDDKTIKFYSDAADSLGLIKTIGSDFHGKTKPSIKLGVIDMPEEDKEMLSKKLV